MEFVKEPVWDLGNVFSDSESEEQMIEIHCEEEEDQALVGMIEREKEEEDKALAETMDREQAALSKETKDQE